MLTDLDRLRHQLDDLEKKRAMLYRTMITMRDMLIDARSAAGRDRMVVVIDHLDRAIHNMTTAITDGR